ncbi:MAG: hypothetical protein KC684_10200 [Candidatus Omnitrophica bacterium]|nr:hypothetical protein [Candidatus Omnitrophota bacterium]
MGKVVKINGEYYVEFYGNGLLFRKKAGTDRALAEKILAEIEATTPQGVMDVPALDVEISILDGEYRAYVQEYCPPQTQQRFLTVLDDFLMFLKEDFPQITTLSGLTPKIIEAYKVRLIKNNLKEHSVNFVLLLLRNIFEFTIMKSWLNDNPTLHLKLFKTQRRVPKTEGDSPLLGISSAPLAEKLRSRIEVNTIAKELLSRHVDMIKVARFLNIKDIARMMYYEPFFKEREDLI